MSLKSETLCCKQTCRISENAQLFSLFRSEYHPSGPARPRFSSCCLRECVSKILRLQLTKIWSTIRKRDILTFRKCLLFSLDSLTSHPPHLYFIFSYFLLLAWVDKICLTIAKTVFNICFHFLCMNSFDSHKTLGDTKYYYDPFTDNEIDVKRG